MKYLWALFGLVALSAGFVIKEAKPLHFDGEVEWQAWKVFHGKKYATETEERARFAIWADNMQVGATPRKEICVICVSPF